MLRAGRLSAFLCLVLTSISWVSVHAADDEKVIVSTSGPRESLKQTIRSLGGRITQEYTNINAVAATVPASTKAALDSIAEFKVSKDSPMFLTTPRDLRGEGSRIVSVERDGDLAVDENTLIRNASAPSDYSFNNALINAASVQASGNLGQNVVVAVIDSGTANSSKVSSLSGTVIGGETFAQGDPLSATSTKNGPHGTWVGSVIAGHGAYLFSNTSCLAQSVKLNAPSAVADGTPYGYPGYSVIFMTGVAPSAKIYALKVFPSNANSTSSSTIIAAMDRAITIKKNYLAGKPVVPVSGSGTEDSPYVYDSLNIQVVNMSLGGPTGIAGRDAEDQLVQQMVALGITVATSAGNAGPSGLTTGSPSTSFASLSSAAASTPEHERIVRDLPATGTTTCRLGRGKVFRPSETIQTAYFSSRGPTADGRVGVDLTTAGDYNLAQAANGGLYFVSGTSFSAPTVAGAAALLAHDAPGASAAQVRNALILGTSRKILGDNSTVFDQGAGYLDVANSLKLLKTGWVPGWILPSSPESEVEENLRHVWLRTSELEAGGSLSGKTASLVSGERKEFYIEVDKNVASLTINVNSVTPDNAPGAQNQLFGDDLILSVHSAKTSSFGEGDYKVFAFVAGPDSFTIPNPEPGILRVTFTGDWTNAGPVSASFTASAVKKSNPIFRSAGKVSEGDLISIPFNMPSGVAEAAFELGWMRDWSRYPTNDIDMIVVDPDGNLNFDGATSAGLERTVIKDPKAGNWQILVNGFTIYDPVERDRWKKDKKNNTDRYNLEVFLK